jgi:hypothetical protein
MITTSEAFEGGKNWVDESGTQECCVLVQQQGRRAVLGRRDMGTPIALTSVD